MAESRPAKSFVVAGLWQSYSARMLPAECTPAQRLAAQRVFYAGAWLLFCALTAVFGDDESAERDIELMGAIQRELEAYGNSATAGGN